MGSEMCIRDSHLQSEHKRLSHLISRHAPQWNCVTPRQQIYFQARCFAEYRASLPTGGLHPVIEMGVAPLPTNTHCKIAKGSVITKYRREWPRREKAAVSRGRIVCMDTGIPGELHMGMFFILSRSFYPLTFSTPRVRAHPLS